MGVGAMEDLMAMHETLKQRTAKLSHAEQEERLLDAFAAIAFKALLEKPQVKASLFVDEDEPGEEDCARMAYRAARAALEERAEQLKELRRVPGEEPSP